MTNIPRLALSFAFLATAMATAAAQSVGDPDRGKEAYAKFGCYQCHGYVGQGALAFGPPLAPRPAPYAAFQAYVRAPRNQMPPYSTNILRDDTMADIYAYVASIKAGPPPSEIKLLNLEKTEPSPAKSADGGTIYAEYCASCHGTPGVGSATAPTLPGKYRGKSARELADLVKSPPEKMPKLFPGALNEADVAAVAAYVARQ